MTAARRTTNSDHASWVLAVVLVLLVIEVHLVPALIAGLLVFEVVHVLAPFLARRLSSSRAKAIAVFLVVSLVVGAVTAAVLGLVVFMNSEGGSFAALLTKMAEIIETSRSTLPTWLADLLPRGGEAIRERAGQWLREHSAELQVIGKETGRLLAHLLIGMVIGGLVSLREAGPGENLGPLARALGERVFRLGEAFRQVVFAQIRISALNTTLTGIYLAIVLPALGIHLPFTKTMIAITFLVGLMPVVGNLISNTVIVTVSLSNSLGAAVGSLAFLILIHKLEYFVNARIVGSQIKARAWELLTAMLVMEAAFGIAGLIAAPIYYAYLKQELSSRGLI